MPIFGGNKAKKTKAKIKSIIQIYVSQETKSCSREMVGIGEGLLGRHQRNGGLLLLQKLLLRAVMVSWVGRHRRRRRSNCEEEAEAVDLVSWVWPSVVQWPFLGSISPCCQ